MNEVQDGCCIIDALCGIDTSSPQISRFTDSFDRIKFLLGNNFDEYTMMIITDINGHVEIVHTDDDVLVKQTDTDSGETSLLWTIGANITAQSGVVIYQVAAYKKSGDDIEAVWYSKEGRLVVTESIDTTSYSAALIGSYPNLLTRLVTEADANKTSIEELAASKADRAELKPIATSGSYTDLTDTPHLSEVAISGNYNDLADKPVVDMQYDSDSGNAQSGRAVAQAIAALVESAPETLDTLDELASALGDDPNFATTIMTMMGGKVDKADGKGLSANDYTSEEKTKLASIAAGAEVNVQPDWNETDTKSDAFIKNKPALKAVATSGSYADLTDVPVLSAIATSGSYADLSDTPVLSAVATSGSYADLTDAPLLLAVATSGSYTDLTDTPDIDGKINTALTNALGDIEAALDSITPGKTYFSNGDTITLADNTEYVATEEIGALTIVYPETDFMCSLCFTLASSGDITIILPESRYIGEIPSFSNGETWELSIKNGIVVGGVAE